MARKIEDMDMEDKYMRGGWRTAGHGRRGIQDEKQRNKDQSFEGKGEGV